MIAKLKDFNLKTYKAASILQDIYDKLYKIYNVERIKYLQLAEILISDIGSLFLFCAFLTLYTTSLDDDNKSLLSLNSLLSGVYSQNEKRILATNPLRIWVAIILLLSILHFILIKIFDPQNVYLFVKLISGILNALAMSLLIARFESHEMRSPLGILVTLYIYALIQSVFGLFGITIGSLHFFVDDFAYFVALVGKTILFLYLYWVFSTKRLTQYFEYKLNAEKLPQPTQELDDGPK